MKLRLVIRDETNMVVKIPDADMYVKHANDKYETFNSLNWMRIAGGYLSGSLTLHDGRKRPLRIRVENIVEMVADPQEALNEYKALIKRYRVGTMKRNARIQELEAMVEMLDGEKRSANKRFLKEADKTDNMRGRIGQFIELLQNPNYITGKYYISKELEKIKNGNYGR